MKKRVLLICAAVFVGLFCACGQNTSPAVSETPQPALATDSDEDGDQACEVVQIGFSLAGEGAFYDQLRADIESECAAAGYSFSLQFASTAERQQSDIMSLLASGVPVLVVNPVDVDAMESALAECESEGVPVINIIDSINGRVSTLISPDYKAAGKIAGQRAVSLFGETGGQCLELKTDYDSFIMQLLSDGFGEALAGSDRLVLASEQYCGDDEEQAYALSKAALLSVPDINFVFAQSAALAHGALRAIQETGSEARLAAFAGDMDLIASVSSGEMDAAVFIGPAEVAQLAVENAGQFLSSGNFKPDSFIELDVDMATADNAADYYAEESLHAQVRSD